MLSSPRNLISFNPGKKPMKTKIIISLIIIAVSACVAAYFIYPSIHEKAVYREMEEKAGVMTLELYSGNYRAHYYESSGIQGEYLILLHGLGGDKTSFLQCVPMLREKFHVILPDLAAHGENSRTGYTDLSIEGQVEFLRRFVLIKGLKEFYLGGNSMGGHISAAFALKYPQMLKSLILINSAGIVMEGNFAYTGYGTPIKDRDELHTALGFGLHRVPVKGFAEEIQMIRKYNSSREFIINKVIPAVRNGAFFNIAGEIHKIKTPTLIIWGAHDRVISLKVAEQFRKEIAGSELIIIDNASHSPQLELPEQVAGNIIRFINK